MAYFVISLIKKPYKISNIWQNKSPSLYLAINCVTQFSLFSYGKGIFEGQILDLFVSFPFVNKVYFFVKNTKNRFRNFKLEFKISTTQEIISAEIYTFYQFWDFTLELLNLGKGLKFSSADEACISQDLEPILRLLREKKLKNIIVCTGAGISTSV